MFKRNMFLTAGLLMVLLILNVGVAFSAWWEGKDLPVPPGAEEIKKENRKMVGLEFEFTYYASGQGMDQVKDFYRKKLVQSGWKERQMGLELKNLDLPEGAPKIDANFFSKAAETNLVFETDDETLSITFLPVELTRGEKTKFTLCRGKKPDPAAQIDVNAIAVPELVEKPKKEVYSVYPQSSLVSLSEGQRSLSATYFTKARIEDVVNFYKSEMSKYEWYLANEKPLGKMNKGVSGQSAGNADCASCAKGVPAVSGASLETWAAELAFSNSRGDGCRVMIAEVIPAEEKYKALGMTTITVNYEEKAK